MFVLVLTLLVGSPVGAAIEPSRLYFGINHGVTLRVTGVEADDVEQSIAIIDPRAMRELARRPIAPDDGGDIDLRALFPEIFEGIAQQTLVYAQAYFGDEPTGAPVVIEPMRSPRVATDARSAAIVTAFLRGDEAALQQLKAMSREQSDNLAGQIVWRDPPERVCAGFRVYRDRFVEFETTLGTMVYAMRPDAAANTCYEFVTLVEGGFYTDVPFHRIVPLDRYGRPFVIQAGDPGGTGEGTPGFSIDFEASDLPHDFGVVSMARELDDPNSNGSQFFICLSREGCARLDGRFVAFAEVVDGGDVIHAIGAAPVGLRDPDDPASAMDRPLDPPMILSARTIDATPITERPARVMRGASSGVER